MKLSIGSAVQQHIPPGSLEEQWDAEALSQALEAEFRCCVSMWRAGSGKTKP